MSTGAPVDDAFNFLAEPDSGTSGNEPPSVFAAGRPATSSATAAGAGPEPAVDATAFDPPEDLTVRLERMALAQNPLREAAQPLLRMLADMPAALESRAAVEGLRALLVREVSAFQKVCDKANLPWKHVAAVRYALCTALDEAANRTRWGGVGVWAARSLLITFEGEVDGGEKFFLLIGRMATDPQEYIDVLEVLYRILGLGFEGRYSVVVDGPRHLEQIRQRLLTLISGARDTLRLELSPHWRGEEPGRMPLLRSVPVWASAGVAALTVFALFAWYKYELLTDTRTLDAKILSIGQAVKVEPTVVPQRLRLSVLLKNEIARGQVTVDEDERSSKVVFKGDYVFLPGQSRIRPELDPVLTKVAQEVVRVGGHVTVTGHTDNRPIRTAEFPNNQVLSEQRAAFVAAALKAHGMPADRVVAVGKGDTQPVADNATVEGRSRNRRVEVFVTQ
ncbi:type VI secretion system protein TssL, long form [Paraburkholderia sp. MMS20-SJTR3]|uniref:Type VI secretion system protein TssL, long form n=1 Tax=Paraburkholderia sejongensis TaxID=2886946 RepID=A0ABS8K0L0_9BURK|nr:type VI secretion system protein TssL, long form [Paraburkholderia sp. MMS20-SJTR3]MCC8395687.1 type VI secretion system protein TssL, long form [Paraburkholderia sp. MMS20-SJTR3]